MISLLGFLECGLPYHLFEKSMLFLFIANMKAELYPNLERLGFFCEIKEQMYYIL